MSVDAEELPLVEHQATLVREASAIRETAHLRVASQAIDQTLDAALSQRVILQQKPTNKASERSAISQAYQNPSFLLSCATSMITCNIAKALRLPAHFIRIQGSMRIHVVQSACGCSSAFC